MKHMRKDCTPQAMTFGGRCMNCGAGYPKPRKLSVAEQTAAVIAMIEADVREPNAEDCPHKCGMEFTDENSLRAHVAIEHKAEGQAQP